MLQNLTGWHALIILAIVLLVFGATKLPGLARSVGQSMRILKDETRRDPDAAAADASTVASAPAVTTSHETTPATTMFAAVTPAAPVTPVPPSVADTRASA